MREIGIFIWVVLLIVGVVGSMISSVRKQTRLQAPPRAPRPWQAPPQAIPPGAVPPAWLERMAQMPAAPPAPPATSAKALRAPRTSRPVESRPASPPAETHRAPSRRRLFDGRPDLVRAVIAAEVLGKPRAFRDEYFEA